VRTQNAEHRTQIKNLVTRYSLLATVFLLLTSHFLLPSFAGAEYYDAADDYQEVNGVRDISTIKSSIISPDLLCQNLDLPKSSDIAINGEIAYVTLANPTVDNVTASIAILNKNDCSIKGFYSHPEMAGPHTIIFHAGFLYVQQVAPKQQKSIIALDVRHGIFPKFASRIYFNGFNGGKLLRAYGNLLISNGNGLTFWDITNPYKIKHLTSVIDAGTACINENQGDIPSSCFTNAGFIDCPTPGWCFAGNGARDEFVSINYSHGLNNSVVVKIVDVLEDSRFRAFNADFTYACNNAECWVMSMATSKSLIKVDITNPTNLRIMTAPNTLNDYAANSWHLSGPVLYAGEESSNGYISAFNVSSSTPYLIYRLQVGSAPENIHRILPEGDRLYVIGLSTGADTGFLKIFSSNGVKGDTGRFNDLGAGNISVDQSARIHGDLHIGNSADISGSLLVSGELSVSGGFKVRSSYEFSDPSVSFNGATEPLQFFSYDDVLYLTEGASEKLYYYPSNIAGETWATIDLSSIGAHTGSLSLAEFNQKLMLSMDGVRDIYYCNNKSGGGISTLCDDVADFTSTGIDTASDVEKFYDMIPHHGRVYVGAGTGPGDGDIHVCNPAAGGAGSDCDDAADWEISDNRASATTAKALEPHGNYLYSGYSADATDAIRYCDDSVNGSCVWATAATKSALDNVTGVNDLLSDGGCLYAATSKSGAAALWRCCTTDGICDNSPAGEWVKYYETTANNINAVTPYNGKIIAATQSAGASGSVFSIDTNGDTGAYNSTQIIDVAGAYVTRALSTWGGALWIGKNGGSGNIYTVPAKSGYVADYLGAVTAGSGVPMIVNQLIVRDMPLTAIPLTNIITPPSDGLYSIRIYATCTTTGATDSLDTVIVGWTDDSGTARSVDVLGGALNCSSLNSKSSGIITINARSIKPITYETAVTYTTGTAKYSLYLDVERRR